MCVSHTCVARTRARTHTPACKHAGLTKTFTILIYVYAYTYIRIYVQPQPSCLSCRPSPAEYTYTHIRMYVQACGHAGLKEEFTVYTYTIRILIYVYTVTYTHIRIYRHAGTQGSRRNLQPRLGCLVCRLSPPGFS